MLKRLTLTVGISDADIIGSTNAELQAAVDRVAAGGGGHVHIKPGVYEMHDSLHLRSHVRVRGAGPTTVLRKAASVQTTIPAFLGYGHYDITVVEPDKLRVGMGVSIRDDRSAGFYDTVATLVWQEGNRFGINRFLNHDYHVADNATVTSIYPLISGSDITHAAVEDIAIEGNSAENPYMNGCRGGGIFLIQAHHVTLRNCLIHDFNGDGISFQQCLRTTIEDCQMLNNTGHGLHPGSGSVAPMMRRLKCAGNGHDGVFYCLRVSYSLLEDSEIHTNGNDGISIGERDTNHLIRRNRITSNGRYGIYFREPVPSYGGNDVVIEENRIGRNCQHSGDAEISIASTVQRIAILRNHFGPALRNMPVIRVGAACESITVNGNETDLAYYPIVQSVENTGVSLQALSQSLDVGPDATPADTALHLGLR